MDKDPHNLISPNGSKIQYLPKSEHNKKHVCDAQCNYERALKAELNQIYTDFASLKEHNAITEKAMLEIFAKMKNKISSLPTLPDDISYGDMCEVESVLDIFSDGEKMVKEYFKLTGGENGTQ
jgi:hypothetical protein